MVNLPLRERGLTPPLKMMVIHSLQEKPSSNLTILNIFPACFTLPPPGQGDRAGAGISALEGLELSRIVIWIPFSPAAGQALEQR